MYYRWPYLSVPAWSAGSQSFFLTKAPKPISRNSRPLTSPGKKTNMLSIQEHQTWCTLYKRQLKAVEHFAYKNFLKGLDLLGFSEKLIPDFDLLNSKLANITGWNIYAVPGLIDNHYFFEQMASKRFGATTWMRTPEQLDYLEEPDLFHDVFGHVPSPIRLSASSCTAWQPLPTHTSTTKPLSNPSPGSTGTR